MDETTAELMGIAKGSKTIAAAFKEIELVKEAFQRSSRIEHKIHANENSILDIKARMELLSTSAYVDSVTQNLKDSIDFLVKSKFDEYASVLLYELNQKITEKDTKKLLDLKSTWSSFNELKGLISSTRLKLDTHIEVDFEHYKSKVDESFKREHQLISDNNQSGVAAIDELKSKFQALEDKVQEVLDEESSVHEDQSEIDFDDMLNDLEKNVVPIKSAESAVYTKPADEFDRLSASRDEITVHSIRKISHKGTRSPMGIGEEIYGFAEPEKAPSEVFGSGVSPSYRKNYKDINSRRSSVISNNTGGGIKQISRKVMLFEKEISQIFEEIRVFKEMNKNIIEDVNKLYQKVAEVNSRCDGIEEFEKKMEYNFINRLRIKDMQNKMKKSNVIVEKVPGEDLIKLSKEVSEKNKKIVQIDNYLKYLITEIDFLKKNQSSKFKDFQDSLDGIEREKRQKDKDMQLLKSGFIRIESNFSEGMRINEDFLQVKPPLSAFDKRRDNDSRLKARRKSQDMNQTIKQDSCSTVGLDKTSISKNIRGFSATPKVLIQPKTLFN